MYWPAKCPNTSIGCGKNIFRLGTPLAIPVWALNYLKLNCVLFSKQNKNSLVSAVSWISGLNIHCQNTVQYLFNKALSEKHVGHCIRTTNEVITYSQLSSLFSVNVISQMVLQTEVCWGMFKRTQDGVGSIITTWHSCVRLICRHRGKWNWNLPFLFSILVNWSGFHLCIVLGRILWVITPLSTDGRYSLEVTMVSNTLYKILMGKGKKNEEYFSGLGFSLGNV